jgi:hypothetical protein
MVTKLWFLIGYGGAKVCHLCGSLIHISIATLSQMILTVSTEFVKYFSDRWRKIEKGMRTNAEEQASR